jgi:putative transcriptional regulator
MQLKSNLPILMAQRRIRSVNQLSQLCGLSVQPLNKLYNNGHVRTDTLVRVCNFFGCKLSELVEYEPTEKEVS